MHIDPYAALNAMVRAEVARSSEPQHSDAAGEADTPTSDNTTGDNTGGSDADPTVARRR
ncbi:hypothetical protein J7E96_29920 [Streptomyces sp. ISL-96]|uniref:hypothetical protein n=1 Tax=Streptomyces sp. ISL-96 TaxID=2819191 RepID=UPI001BE7106A|nr:hypothetical protein [Streptomyces sp. ISL-96]MBT2492653.1 hypothetical protein [Streptomyces sp. ISL-96]